jgi:hypothetical protein
MASQSRTHYAEHRQSDEFAVAGAARDVVAQRGTPRCPPTDWYLVAPPVLSAQQGGPTSGEVLAGAERFESLEFRQIINPANV